MRFLFLAGTALVTIGLIFIFDSRQVLPAPLGKLLSPQHGIWQNAEPANISFNDELRLPGLKGKTDVYFDEQLVPHVFAEDEQDAYYVQGYLHAKFRLWQMEFQTHAAAGRLSEILGEGPGGRILDYDRNMRRLGMTYAAEKSVAEVEKSPASKAQYESYADGVNAYIDQLTESQLPIEYKLLGYYPEKWTTLKTALFLKYMSYDLAGGESDLEFTNARNNFSKADFEKLFYYLADSLKPIAPNTPESPYPAVAAMDLAPPANADSAYFGFRRDSLSISHVNTHKPNPENGSNNWAVAGSKTKSGRPILCNDPHLGLNLPSLWYEMQITTPNFSAYGATFPGSPNVIIGFNQNISFGFTNAGRDVKDYYEIEFQDDSKAAYLYNGKWLPSDKRVEVIKIKGKPDLLDTVTYTIFGPVMYDENYRASEKDVRNLAVRWKAHDASNDGLAFYGLNHAKNYPEYLEAIKNLTCPGQNCIFASRSGDIAIWQQGQFPAKWRRQGDFIMPGKDSSYRWKGMIPQAENPHLVNPSRGYVSSANQLSVDGSYPYYTGDVFPVYRGYIVNRYLDTAKHLGPEDMMRMQTDNYNVKAEFARDILERVNSAQLDEISNKYYSIYKQWDNRYDVGAEGAIVFTLWWAALEKATWGDEFGKVGLPLPNPGEYVLVESLHRDSAYSFIDNINTPEKETLEDLLVSSLKEASDSLEKLSASGLLPWEKVKDTHIRHLLKVIDPFSRLHLPIGGGKGVINATEADHGPSWRMIVHMTDDIEAYGVYPGGQSGNPGSAYYDNFVDDWVAGKYHKLWLMKKEENTDPRIKWTMHFSKS
ncbi:penicillin acylase family protein [Flavihumibacter profundi]|jgi:penicillin G amidase|uniref:penicillin acylase family protein n=1 Tax=Flavihumibacter profundi TaxID=2716883 RepID=UPI001CC336C6|nr:penicillin acylase family protein [Flavihumibacter profundi]MBZ5855906.1 penicillin acylase family protein [Flavihumibacter profundi]